MTALPDSIIQNGLFCCWKYEERNGRKTKMPYQPETGLGAKSNDPSSFVPYKTAVQASGYDGIGIGIFNGICAIDLDNCVSDSGYYTQTAAEIVALIYCIYCISCLTLVTPVPTLKSAEFSVDRQGEYYGLLPANGRKIMSMTGCE